MLKWREIGAEERKDWFETRLRRDFPADEVKPFELLESCVHRVFTTAICFLNSLKHQWDMPI